MKSIQLNTLAVVYNLHFRQYSKGKKKVTQLILSAIWKSVYATYKSRYSNCTFEEEL
jgi:hypothetical protein